MKVININMKGVSQTAAKDLNQTVGDLIQASQVYQDLVKEFAEELLKVKTLPTPNQFNELFHNIHAITMSQDPSIKDAIIASVSKMNVFSEEDRELKDEESELN